MDHTITTERLLPQLILLLIVFYAISGEHRASSDDVVQESSVALQKSDNERYSRSERSSRSLDAAHLAVKFERGARMKRRAAEYRSHDSYNDEAGVQDNLTEFELYHVILIAAGLVLLSVTTLSLCAICDSCVLGSRKKKALETNGYIGKINLADIKVIYNPAAAGAVHLPVYAHGAERSADGFSNQAFSRSQESLNNTTNAAPTPSTLPVKQRFQVKDPSPAILQVSKLEEQAHHQKTKSGNKNRDPAAVHAGTKTNSHATDIDADSRAAVKKGNSGRLVDLYVEKGNRIVLTYENEHAAENSFVGENDQVEKSGKNSKNTNMANDRLAGSSAAKSVEYGDDGVNGSDKYDANDTAIRNMYVR